jgi:adenylate kinase family enzyme
VQANRIKVFFAQTAPLTEFYRKRGQLVEIDGEQPIPAVTEALSAAAQAAIGR